MVMREYPIDYIYIVLDCHDEKLSGYFILSVHVTCLKSALFVPYDASVLS